MKRIRLAGAALALALATGCARNSGDAKPAGADSSAAGGDANEAVAQVRIALVEMRTFADQVDAPGQWKSSGDLVVAAPFDGTVESIGPRPGDRVNAGETLAVLVTRESEAALRGAELMVTEAKDEAARSEAERALALAKRDVVRVPVNAPHAGVVSHRAAEAGALLAQGAEIVTLVPESAIVFEARVAPHDAARVRVGQRATITEEGEASREARLERVLPVAGSGDQSLLVWLAPERAAAPPALDRYALAHIALGPAHRAAGVPDSAAVEDDLTGALRVAVVGEDQRITWTPVTLGAADRGWREIRSGALPAGARVVAEGQRGLPDRVRVRAAP
jgi:multidrug efflux pump subunit AcrA (membrane-fusion protein)